LTIIDKVAINMHVMQLHSSSERRLLRRFHVSLTLSGRSRNWSRSRSRVVSALQRMLADALVTWAKPISMLLECWLRHANAMTSTVNPRVGPTSTCDCWLSL
jgi:hypothetical protein